MEAYKSLVPPLQTRINKKINQPKSSPLIMSNKGTNSEMNATPEDATRVPLIQFGGNEADRNRNLICLSMSNEELLTVVKGAVADAKAQRILNEKKDKRKTGVRHDWNILLKTKLFNNPKI